MTFIFNEGKPHELRDGERLLLAFRHDGYQYVTDRGEHLGREWNAALRKAQELAKERR